MEQTLMDVGLSKNETKGYIALIELGPSTVTKISQISRVHRTNLYEALERLKKKGIVSSFLKNNTLHYEATDPNILLTFLKDKEAKLNAILPQLELAKNLSRPQNDIEIREGLTALKATYSEVLKQKKPIYTFGSPKAAAELAKPFLDQFHKKRIELKIQMYHIYNEDAVERISELKNLPFTSVRVLPPEYNSHISTGICGDEVSIKNWDKKEGFAIVIRNPKVAKTYKNYFDLLWNIAKQA